MKIHLMSLGCVHEVVNVIISEEWDSGPYTEGLVHSYQEPCSVTTSTPLQKLEKYRFKTLGLNL